MKTVMITSNMNTTVVRRGQVKEVEATPWIEELIAVGTLIDVTPPPPKPVRKPRKPKPKPEETDDAPVEDLD